MFVQWNKGSTKSIDCSRDMILFTQNEEVRLWNRSCTLAWTRRFEHFCSRHYVVGGLVCNAMLTMQTLSTPYCRIQIELATLLTAWAIHPVLSWMCLSKLLPCWYPKWLRKDLNPQPCAHLASVRTIGAICHPRFSCIHQTCELGHVVHSNSERHLIVIPVDMWTSIVTSWFFEDYFCAFLPTFVWEVRLWQRTGNKD